MQWTDDANGGFSRAPNDPLLHSAITDVEFGSKQVNPAAQQHDPNSLFTWPRRLAEMRKNCPEIGWGDCNLPQGASSSVVVQRYTLEGTSVLVLHNLGRTNA